MVVMVSVTQTTHRFEAVIQRLSETFPGVRRDVVESAVHTAAVCAEHLEFAVTDGLVERMAEERLRGRLATRETLP